MLSGDNGRHIVFMEIKPNLSTKCVKFSQFLFILLAIILSGSVLADDNWLTINISGVTPKLEKNIHAHLGTLPENDVQRRAYLFSVDNNAQDALESMGYYHGIIDIDVKENATGPWAVNINITLGDPVLIQWIDIRFEGEMLEDETFKQWLNGLKINPVIFSIMVFMIQLSHS